MSRFLAASAVIVGLLAIGWGALSLPAPADPLGADARQSQILAAWPNQPAWFVTRSRLPLCGEERVDASRQGDEESMLAQRDTAGRECLFQAFRAQTGAEFVERVDTFEGPVLAVYRVQAGGVLEVIEHDARRGEGAAGWRLTRCTRIGPYRDVARQIGIAGPIDDRVAEAMVFLHDIRSCERLPQPDDADG